MKLKIIRVLHNKALATAEVREAIFEELKTKDLLIEKLEENNECLYLDNQKLKSQGATL